MLSSRTPSEKKNSEKHFHLTGFDRNFNILLKMKVIYLYYLPTYLPAYLYVCVYAFACICIYIYIYTYTYMSIYIYICICVCIILPPRVLVWVPPPYFLRILARRLVVEGLGTGGFRSHKLENYGSRLPGIAPKTQYALFNIP